MPFDSAKSLRFAKDVAAERGYSISSIDELSEIIGANMPVDVDEIVPRFLGGQQVPHNQRIVPATLNRSLGPREASAVSALRLRKGTRIVGFDLEFY